MRTRFLPRLGLGFAIVLAAGLPASGAPSPAPSSSPEVCPAIDTPAVQAQGIRAAIDPATGKLRPLTAQERRKLASARVSRAGRTYEILVRPDGTRVVELDDAFFMSVKATKRPDGTLGYRCVSERPAAGAEAK